MRLDGPIDHLASHVGGRDLNHCDFLARLLVANRVHLVSGVEHQQANLVDHDSCLGNALLGDGLLGDRLAERDTRFGTLAHSLQGALGNAYLAHAMMNAARAKATLRNFKATAFAKQDIRCRHTHIFEVHLGMAVGRIVIAENRQRTNHLDTGRIHRYHDHRLLLVPVGIGRIGLTHEDEHLAARIWRTRRPPFAAVDDIFVAVTLDARLNVGGVGRSHGRLGHGKGRADLAGEKRL